MWTVVFTSVHYDDHYMISVLQKARSGTGTITDFAVRSVNKRKKTKRVIGFECHISLAGLPQDRKKKKKKKKKEIEEHTQQPTFQPTIHDIL